MNSSTSLRVARWTASGRPGRLCLHHRPQLMQRRYLFGSLFGRGRKNVSEPNFQPENPAIENFLKKRQSNRKPVITQGGLAKGSIFREGGDDAVLESSRETEFGNVGRSQYVDRASAPALDPRPIQRMRWQRKMVIRQVRRRGRLSTAVRLKQQERESTLRSHEFKTSVKKLVPLAKQIAGKTLEDAITQMRFSKKLAAKDVRDHLILARNEAVVKRGMGLGDNFAKEKDIVTKDKRFIKVANPTTIYVDQAWCGKGKWDPAPEYRARGRMNVLKKRYTSLTVVLKEEKTRIRLHEEREEKLRNRKVWTQLHNRPITAQRQYYSW